jgi:hypothetical protein
MPTPKQIEDLKARVRSRAGRPRVPVLPPDPPPRYDRLFALGTAWLRSLEDPAYELSQ